MKYGLYKSLEYIKKMDFGKKKNNNRISDVLFYVDV